MTDAGVFDVIVIGGGHAGTEAALASARIGAQTLLITHQIDTLGQMSCNPAIGGIGKGHLVKEIDALGGAMAIAADHAGIHFRTLNGSKGPAVRATRAQADRSLYKQAIRQLLENQENLSIFQQPVDDLLLEGERVCGVKTQSGLVFKARSIVLTAGTFLGGKIHVGCTNYAGGRAGDMPANTLAARLRELPLNVGRLKTGTPPRIATRTINFAGLTEQPSDSPRPVFSFLGTRAHHPRQVSCFITHTNAATHALIRGGLSRSPLYTGIIDGVGPRYCPSVEDKVVRFTDKQSHQIFIEPEGLDTQEVYPNGISTSLPYDVQVAFVRSIKGFEQAHITRPGYAIEYDYFDPRDLKSSLETKHIAGLFFAGQINGTTGYEEAAAQGLVAGINAARRVFDLPSWSPQRDEAYIGVLIDDLITQGATEPYRMFTSRAEYRLSLREDNADLRLTPIGRQLGVVNDVRWEAFSRKQEALQLEQERLKSLWIRPETSAAQALASRTGEVLEREYSALSLLCRPSISYQDLISLAEIGPGISDELIAEQIEIQVRYAGYIDRQQQDVQKLRATEHYRLPDSLDYERVRGLSIEVREKLSRGRPETLGQAARVPGVTPAAISLLQVYLKKHAQELCQAG